ncbi:hypothetical protein TYRP_022222 [Tyrophagus putrescentiae]|nr:hypothetical protein TYRP_022222 [Tyrophagus putrescentiae]
MKADRLIVGGGEEDQSTVEDEQKYVEAEDNGGDGFEGTLDERMISTAASVQTVLEPVDVQHEGPEGGQGEEEVLTGAVVLHAVGHIRLVVEVVDGGAAEEDAGGAEGVKEGQQLADVLQIVQQGDVVGQEGEQVGQVEGEEKRTSTEVAEVAEVEVVEVEVICGGGGDGKDNRVVGGEGGGDGLLSLVVVVVVVVVVKEENAKRQTVELLLLTSVVEGDDWRGGCGGWRAGEGDGNLLRHDEQRHEGEGKQRQAADGEDGPGQQQSEVIGMAGLTVVVLLQMVRLIKVLLVIDGDSLVSVEGHTVPTTDVTVCVGTRNKEEEEEEEEGETTEATLLMDTEA